MGLKEHYIAFTREGYLMHAAERLSLLSMLDRNAERLKGVPVYIIHANVNMFKARNGLSPRGNIQVLRARSRNEVH